MESRRLSDYNTPTLFVCSILMNQRGSFAHDAKHMMKSLLGHYCPKIRLQTMRSVLKLRDAVTL